MTPSGQFASHLVPLTWVLATPMSVHLKTGSLWAHIPCTHTVSFTAPSFEYCAVPPPCDAAFAASAVSAPGEESPLCARALVRPRPRGREPALCLPDRVRVQPEAALHLNDQRNASPSFPARSITALYSSRPRPFFVYPVPGFERGSIARGAATDEIGARPQSG